MHEIMTSGKPDAVEKAVFLAKFHSGLDASTLVDRFNSEAWPQLVGRTGTDPARLRARETGHSSGGCRANRGESHLASELPQNEESGMPV